MASARRIEQVNILLREVTASIIAREILFPEGVLVTVTRAESSEDLHYAYIYVSMLGGQAGVEETVMAELKQNIGLIQHNINKKLRMRPVPRITFAIDKDEKRRERIEKLLSQGSGAPD